MYIQTCMQLNLWHGKYNSSLLYRNLIHWHEMSERAGEDVVGDRERKLFYWKKVCMLVCLFVCLLAGCSGIINAIECLLLLSSYLSGVVVRMENYSHAIKTMWILNRFIIWTNRKWQIEKAIYRNVRVFQYCVCGGKTPFKRFSIKFHCIVRNFIRFYWYWNTRRTSPLIF